MMEVYLKTHDHLINSVTSKAQKKISEGIKSQDWNESSSIMNTWEGKF